MTSSAMRVLLVDDEPLARMRLRSLLTDITFPRTEVCGEAGTAAQTMVLIESTKPHVLLLDIHMPGMDGMQLAQRLGGVAAEPQIIFVTASSEFALQAFDVAAVDYLTKPVRSARLQQALCKAAARLSLESEATQSVFDVPGREATNSEVLLIQERGRSQRIQLNDILYAHAEQKYVILYMRSGQECVWDGSLNQLEAQYLENFIRIHRATLVQRHALRQLKRSVQADGCEGWLLQLHGLSSWLQVSRRQLAVVRQAMKGL